MYLLSRAGRTRLLTAMAVGLAAAVITATALSPALGTGPEGITTFSGSSSSAVVYSTNSSTGTAVEGVTGTVAGGKALWGVANNALHAGTGVRASAYGPSSFGLFGEALNTDKAHPSYGLYATSKSGYAVYANTAVAGLTSLFAINTDATSTTSHAIKGQSRGDAITGISTKANGVVGQVSATPTPAPFAAFAQAGVLGKDTSIGANNVGVWGESGNGVGVYGHTDNSSLQGVLGVNSNGGQGVKGLSYSGDGVFGISSIGTGVEGDSSGSIAVKGVSSSSVGVAGVSTSSIGVDGSSTSGEGVFGDSSTNMGVEGDSTSSTGVFGSSGSGIGVIASSASDTQPALEAGSGSGSVTPSASVAVVRVQFAKTQSCGGVTQFDIFTIDQKGDVKACGTITASTTPLVVQRTSLGQPLVSYAAQQSQPTIEDFGQGRLVNGQAYVPLESRFAATIDVRANYLVFLTPRGDNRGLYVAQTTRAGFVVRESQGGRSTLAFDYRIVAKPYDTNAPRLPLASSLPHPRPVTLPPLRNQTRLNGRPHV